MVMPGEVSKIIYNHVDPTNIRRIVYRNVFRTHGAEAVSASGRVARHAHYPARIAYTHAIIPVQCTTTQFDCTCISMIYTRTSRSAELKAHVI